MLGGRVPWPQGHLGELQGPTFWPPPHTRSELPVHRVPDPGAWAPCPAAPPPLSRVTSPETRVWGRPAPAAAQGGAIVTGLLELTALLPPGHTRVPPTTPQVAPTVSHSSEAPSATAPFRSRCGDHTPGPGISGERKRAALPLAKASGVMPGTPAAQTHPPAAEKHLREMSRMVAWGAWLHQFFKFRNKSC